MPCFLLSNVSCCPNPVSMTATPFPSHALPFNPAPDYPKNSRHRAISPVQKLTNPAPQHMTDRSHCKLLYDEDEDLHEYESFYDFSASYSDAEKTGIVADGDGNAATPAAADGEGEEESDGETVEVSRTLGVTDLGELVLLDGKTVGNRKWSR